MKTNTKATVSSKGQVVIPQKIRQALGIHAGSELIVSMRNQTLEFKLVKGNITKFFGRCKRLGTSPLSIADMDKAIATAVKENVINIKGSKT
jgi:antitoxin PrlF